MTRMIDWLWQKIAAIAGWPAFVVILAIGIVFNVLFKRYGSHYPEATFDGRACGFRPSEVAAILKKFSDAGQLDRYFAQETQLDLIFPLVYSLLFAVIIVGVGSRLPHWVVAIPFAAALFDYCENFTYIALIVRYRATQTVPPALAVIGAVASRLKWGFVFLSLAAIFAAIVDHSR